MTWLQVDLARGERMKAKQKYEKILGKALRGYGPSEHWAHAEYAYLLYEDGDQVDAMQHINMALEVATLPDSIVEPADMASYSFRLGKMLWEQPDATECVHKSNLAPSPVARGLLNAVPSHVAIE